MDMISIYEEVVINKLTAKASKNSCINVEVYATPFLPNLERIGVANPNSKGSAIKRMLLILVPHLVHLIDVCFTCEFKVLDRKAHSKCKHCHTDNDRCQYHGMRDRIIHD